MTASYRYQPTQRAMDDSWSRDIADRVHALTTAPDLATAHRLAEDLAYRLLREVNNLCPHKPWVREVLFAAVWQLHEARRAERSFARPKRSSWRNIFRRTTTPRTTNS